MNPKYLVQRSTLYFLCTIAGRAVGFVLIPLYSHYLTPAQYGTIELLELAIQILSLCFGLQSIGTALTRLFHDEGTAQGKNLATATALGMTVAANLLVIGAVFPFAGSLSALVLRSSEYAWLVRAGLMGLLFSTLVEVVLTYVRLRDRVILFVAYTLASLVATALLNVYFIAFLGLGVWGFVLSKLIVTGAGCVWLLVMTLREVGFGLSQRMAQEMWRFGSPLIVANLAFFVIHFSDRFFLSAARGLDEVGTYSLAYRFAFLVTIMVAEPFERVWNVTLFSYTNQPGWELDFARVARYLTVALCITGLGLSLFGEIIIRFVSTSLYYSAAAVLPILAFAYVVREIGDFYRNILYINRSSAVVGGVAVISALVNLGLNYALIARFGMFGAAWATLLTWTLYMVLCWVRARKEHAIPFDIRSFSIAIGLSAGIYILITFMPRLPLMLEVASRLAWVAIFILLLGALRYFPKEEMYSIRRRVSNGCEGLGRWVKART